MPSVFKEIKRRLIAERSSLAHSPQSYPATTEQAIQLIEMTGRPYLEVRKVQYITVYGRKYPRVALPRKLIAYWGYPTHLFMLYNTGYILLYPAYVVNTIGNAEDKKIDLNNAE